MNKRYLLALLGGLGSRSAAAQQAVPPLKKEFLDSTFTVLPSEAGARYRRETEYTDSVGGVMRDFFLNGKLQSIGTYEHFRKGIVNGTFENWYDNGQLKWHQEYAHGKLAGEKRLYYASGQLKRRETYVDDKRTDGECFGPTGARVAFFEYFVMPVYSEGDGSNTAIIRAVAQGVKYPMKALKANVEGRVFVTFVVTKSGAVSDARVVKSIHPQLDAAALQAVRNLKRFTPGQCDGEIAAVSYTVPINFQIGAERSSVFEKRTTYQLSPK